MKYLKRFASVALALIMALALAAPAFAATTKKITIAADPDKTDFRYNVYQIFTGDEETKEDGTGTGKFSKGSIEWGSAIPENKRAAFVAALASSATPGNETVYTYFEDFDLNSNYTAGDVAERLDRGSTNKAAADEIAAIALQFVEGGVSKQINPGDTQNNEWADQDTGYYLIVASAPGTSVPDTNILRNFFEGRHVVSPKEDPKESKVEKWVKNSHYGETGHPTANDEWVKVTDYEVGKTFQFKIEGSLPADYESQSDFWMTFTDTQAQGFTTPDHVAVTVTTGDGTSKDVTISESDYRLTRTATGFELQIESNMKEKAPWKDLKNEDKIVITYDTSLKAITGTTPDKADGNVVLGDPGNVNTVTMTSASGGGTDKATVFTFRLEVDKLDGEGRTDAEGNPIDPLAGAAFKLSYLDPTKTDEDKWTSVGEYTKEANISEFKFSGLKAGKYRLEETEAPEGYHIAGPWYFEIVATYKTDTATGNQVLDDFKIQQNTGTGGVAEGGVVNLGTKADTSTTTTPNKDGGLVKWDVVNNSGLKLPETGGIGTTIFYIVGGVLVVGAVVLLITKRRTGTDEE